MKSNSINLLIISLLFLYKCSEDTNIITNHINEQNLTYNSDYADFRSLNSGAEKYSVNLEWENYLGSDFVSYDILSDDDIIIHTIDNQNTTNQTIEMILNNFKDLTLILNTTTSNQHIDTIGVFTRPISPITNFSITAYSASNQLNWTPSEDNDIQEIVIYRAESNSQENGLPLINDNEGNIDFSVWEIIEQPNLNISSYTDNSIITSSTYYYLIKVTDTNQGYRYSYINSNISEEIDNGTVLGLENNYSIGLTSSETLNNEIFSDKIKISWSAYTYNDFYEFEIWKSENPNFEINSSEATLIVTVTNPDIAIFEDYNNVGENKTWYYQMRLYNIYGNFMDSQIIECNTSL